MLKYLCVVPGFFWLSEESYFLYSIYFIVCHNDVKLVMACDLLILMGKKKCNTK